MAGQTGDVGGRNGLHTSTPRARQVKGAGRRGRPGLEIAPQLGTRLARRPPPPALIDPGRRPTGDEAEKDGDEHDDPQWDADRQNGVGGRNRVERHGHQVAVGDGEDDEQEGGKQAEDARGEAFHLSNSLLVKDRPRSAALLVQPIAQFLAGLEERNPLGVDGDGIAGPRIATLAGVAALDGKRPEPAELDAVSARERDDDFVENCIDDSLNVAVIEMRVLLSDQLYQLGFDHSTPRARLLTLAPDLTSRSSLPNRQ